MARCRWIAQVATQGIVAVLVLKGAIDNEELLPAPVRVGRKGAAGSVPNNGGRARHLFADPVEHLALDARHRRSNPVDVTSVDHGALAEIGVDSHREGARSTDD